MTRKTTPKPDKAKAKSAPAPKTEAAAKTSKIDQIVALLRRKEGATIEAMTTATGWQAHTVRGAMSGALKKKAGLSITSEKVDGVRTYRIADEAGA